VCTLIVTDASDLIAAVTPLRTVFLTGCYAVAVAAAAECDGVTQYQDLPDQIVCKTVRDPCEAGSYQANPATPTSDLDCQPCNGITEYQPQAAQTRCLAASPQCVAGTFEKESVTPIRDRECEACAGGT